MTWAGASVAQADVVIDSFAAAHAAIVSGGPAGPAAATDVLNPADVLGGERDILVTRISSNSNEVYADVAWTRAGALSLNSDGFTQGSVLVVYDGVDGDATAINYVGLGGVDLTQGGVNDRFVVSSASDDGATLVITVYSDATHYSTASVAVPADVSYTFHKVGVEFAAFATGSGAAGPANFANVGAITLLVVGASEATDASINYFVTSKEDVTPNEPPSPSFLPLSPGYWKNHAEAWPVTSLMLGSQTYTQAELLKLMAKPGGDASTILAFQLIAAKLNLLSGADPAPIAGLVSQGDALLSLYGGKLPYKVKTSSTIGKQMTGIGDALSALWY